MNRTISRRGLADSLMIDQWLCFEEERDNTTTLQLEPEEHGAWSYGSRAIKRRHRG